MHLTANHSPDTVSRPCVSMVGVIGTETPFPELLVAGDLK